LKEEFIMRKFAIILALVFLFWLGFLNPEIMAKEGIEWGIDNFRRFMELSFRLQPKPWKNSKRFC